MSEQGPLKVNKTDSMTRNQPFLIKTKSFLHATISGAYIFSHVSSMSFFKIILHRAMIFCKKEVLPSGYSCPCLLLINSVNLVKVLVNTRDLNFPFPDFNPKVFLSFSLEITDHACSLACFPKALGKAQQYNRVQRYENTA